jgi:hypothetical protein
VGLPTHFVSRSAPPEPILTSAETAIHAIDNFFTTHGTDLVEWLVVVGPDGRLHALNIEQHSKLPSHIQSQLAFNDVARAGSARVLNLSEFYLFDLKVAEQPSDEPGLNDPVYLYGTLCGPYGCEVTEKPAAFEGQVALTRADVLDGAIWGLNHAFRYANARAFHLMVPADREERIAQGCGVALAYPLMPAELLTSNPANEVVINQLVFDMLTAMKHDVTKTNDKHPLRNQMLPVPSRVLVEKELVKQGYRIDGNTAVKTPQAKGMVGELLLSIFSDYVSKRVPIPPEGTVEQFIEITKNVLSALRDWPSGCSRALRARFKRSPFAAAALPANGPAAPPAAAATPIMPPAPRQQIPAASPRRPNIYRPKGDSRKDWMQDFVDLHRKPGSTPPKLTRVEEMEPSRQPRGLARTEANEGPKKDWMKDFE